MCGYPFRRDGYPHLYPRKFILLLLSSYTLSSIESHSAEKDDANIYYHSLLLNLNWVYYFCVTLLVAI
jgi:hypothetical protein